MRSGCPPDSALAKASFTRNRPALGWAVALASVRGSLAWQPEAAATPAAIFGSGPESQALAGTGASYATGYHAARLNPAALSHATSKQFALGVHAVNYALQAEGEAPG